ncbi:hypothetical protein KCV07_g8868, partial [Aureobasidium melanogenum]
MDCEDFHSSLQQLRLQLDFMNKRTASILNKSHQHPNKVTHNSSQVGHFPPVIMAENAQQIKHIGTTLGALASQQEDRFQKLEHQLNLLSDKLDDLALNHPRFTPPESFTSSMHEEPEPCFHQSFAKSFNTPRRPLDMPHATAADLGGYFYPNHIHYSHSDEQYISNASTFVGRVNRTLCTKSITNIEIFLRGSALRWFHIGLRIDGSHTFDDENGEMDIAKFCQSLILLFGMPESSRPGVDIEALHLTSAFMRSVILDDYIFPVLETARQQGTLANLEVIMSKAIKRYNQSSLPITLNPDIIENKDLLDMLVCLRRSEFDQQLDKILSQKRRHLDTTVSAKIPSENTKKAGLTHKDLRQYSVSLPVNETHRQGPPLTRTGVTGKPPVAKSDDVRAEIITELTAARDCCGETVLDPVEHKQKMRQCIDFLADERVEVLSDFEEKVAALKNWLHKNQSHQDSDDEIKLLWHRVAYMIWIHEQRIQEDALQHFESRLSSNSATTGKAESPKSQIMQAQNEDCILKNRVEEATVAKARIGKSDPLNLGTPKMPERTKPKFVGSIEAATEPYPPAPTVESSPATPVLPCQVPASSSSEARQMRGLRELFQDVATIDSGEADHSIPVSREIAMKSGLQPGHQPTQQHVLQMQRQMRMQQTAQQQHNALKRDGGIQTECNSEKLFCQQSSAFGTYERPESNRHDEYLHSPQLADSPKRDIESDVPSSEQDNDLPTPTSSRANSDPIVPNPATAIPLTTSEADGLDVPEGAENCLAGLSFAFAGQLTYISKQEAQKLVKRYGGKCTTSPSKNTSFVVLGTEASLKRLATIKEHNLCVIDEKDFFALISRLPARACPVLEKKLERERIQKKTESIKSAAEDILVTAQNYQRDESYINPHMFYESGCAAVKSSMEEIMTHLELGPLDDQNWTNYAQMLEEHAAAVAEESKQEAEVPPCLPPKLSWREREASRLLKGRY